MVDKMDERKKNVKVVVCSAAYVRNFVGKRFFVCKMERPIQIVLLIVYVGTIFTLQL